MNLENLNLVELNAQEVKEVDGGWKWIWQAALGNFIYNVFSDWEANVAAFNKGMKAAQ